MRIVAGMWRGRGLIAPAGQTTRPTADRARQAVFDMLMHAPWAGRSVIEGASVLDGFAGTGALGLEALSRGAARTCFVEADPAALRALRSNIAACHASDRAEVLATDILRIGAGPLSSLIFLDPPYGQDLIPRALGRLRQVGRIGADSLVVAETGHQENWTPQGGRLAERRFGAARVLFFHAQDA